MTGTKEWTRYEGGTRERTLESSIGRRLFVVHIVGGLSLLIEAHVHDAQETGGTDTEAQLDFGRSEFACLPWRTTSRSGHLCVAGQFAEGKVATVNDESIVAHTLGHQILGANEWGHKGTGTEDLNRFAGTQRNDSVTGGRMHEAGGARNDEQRLWLGQTEIVDLNVTNCGCKLKVLSIYIVLLLHSFVPYRSWDSLLRR